MWFGDQTLPQIHDDQPRAGRAALAMGFARPALSSYTTCWDTTLREAGGGGAGGIEPMSLEGSNVDLSDEFSQMITTQRAYTAASKIITTTDELLDELLRIKR